jgi:hypothetical protein
MQLDRSGVPMEKEYDTSSPEFKKLVADLYEWCQEESRKELAEKLKTPKKCKACLKTRSLEDFMCIGANKWDSDCKMCREVESRGVDKLSERDREHYGNAEKCGLCSHHFPRKYLSSRESVRWGILCNGCQDIIDRNRHKHLVRPLPALENPAGETPAPTSENSV